MSNRRSCQSGHPSAAVLLPVRGGHTQQPSRHGRSQTPKADSGCDGHGHGVHARFVRFERGAVWARASPQAQVQTRSRWVLLQLGKRQDKEWSEEGHAVFVAKLGSTVPTVTEHDFLFVSRGGTGGSMEFLIARDDLQEESEFTLAVYNVGLVPSEDGGLEVAPGRSLDVLYRCDPTAPRHPPLPLCSIPRACIDPHSHMRAAQCRAADRLDGHQRAVHAGTQCDLGDRRPPPAWAIGLSPDTP